MLQNSAYFFFFLDDAIFFFNEKINCILIEKRI